MKTLLKPLLILSTILFFNNTVQSQDLPRPSQSQKITQKIGLTDVTINYSRPNAKGREIFGGLVPYEKVWRVGANAATTFDINSIVSIQGQSLIPGKYAMFAMPKDDGVWQLMINTKWDQWGSRDYNPDFDLVSVSVPVQTMNDFTETFTIGFDHVVGDNAIMYLLWANTRVDISIEANSKEQAMENINKKIEELDNAFSSYNSIARYLAENGDPVIALEYAQKSVDLKEVFWNLKTLSEAYAANKNYKMAIETAEKSLKLSQEAGNKSYENQNEANLEKWKAMK